MFFLRRHFFIRAEGFNTPLLAAGLLILIIPMIFCISCLHSKTGTSTLPVHKSIKVNYGNAVFKIHGQLSENLYVYRPNEMRDDPINYYDNPVMKERAIAKNETVNLTTGETYAFSILPKEVVTINVLSSDENDVEISVFEYGQEKKHTLKGADRLGLSLSFQNRNLVELFSKLGRLWNIKNTLNKAQ